MRTMADVGGTSGSFCPSSAPGGHPEQSAAPQAGSFVRALRRRPCSTWAACARAPAQHSSAAWLFPCAFGLAVSWLKLPHVPCSLELLVFPAHPAHVNTVGLSGFFPSLPHCDSL